MSSVGVSTIVLNANGGVTLNKRDGTNLVIDIGACFSYTDPTGKEIIAKLHSANQTPDRGVFMYTRNFDLEKMRWLSRGDLIHEGLQFNERNSIIFDSMALFISSRTRKQTCPVEDKPNPQEIAELTASYEAASGRYSSLSNTAAQLRRQAKEAEIAASDANEQMKMTARFLSEAQETLLRSGTSLPVAATASVSKAAGSSTSTHIPLPPGWASSIDTTTGSVYYYNNATGATQWERPTSGGKRKISRKNRKTKKTRSKRG